MIKAGAVPPQSVNFPSWPLFPIRAGVRGRTRLGAEFDLCLRWKNAGGSSIETDVEAAVWAWATYGGLGSRTRRGCGALYCSNFDPEFMRQPRPAFVEHWRRYVAPTGHIKDWACVSDDPLFDFANPSDPIGAWIQVVTDFHDARRGGHSSPPLSPPLSTRVTSPVVFRPITFHHQGRLYAYPMLVSLSVRPCNPSLGTIGANTTAIQALRDYFQEHKQYQ